MIDFLKYIPFILDMLYLFQSYHISKSENFHGTILIRVLIFAQQHSSKRPSAWNKGKNQYNFQVPSYFYL